MIITGQTEIQAPIEVIFSYLEDNDKQKEWMTGLEGTEYLTMFESSNPVSVKFKQRLREGNRIQEYEGQVTEYNKNNRLSIQMNHPSFLINVSYNLQEISPNTSILSIIEEVTAKTFFRKDIKYPFSRIYEKRFRETNEGIETVY
ncbi:SRPBCC family protein [Bacillus massiliglaciei]|uniref:SRPBCC family protein n=1 Tax=Bacillus massiliglaciei TaxID=1816693 RepID=UPI000B04EB10|nr:SRPBCC family protein [Bacillus massiliglaciei]